MDPVSVISIVTGAASLALQCAQVVKSLHDISGKFKDAHLAISSALQELEIIQLAWERIERLLRTWEDIDEADAELLQRLSRQLEFGDMIMTALLEDISGYQRGSYSFRRRSKVVWNESLFRAHQDRIRGQATAMTLLLSVLQLSSAIERKENLTKGEAILKKSDESAMSIVPSRMSSRFSFASRDSRRQSADSSKVIYQELSIDDELFTAKVYKRNYRNDIMHYKSRARQPKRTLEANKIDDQVSSELPAIIGWCVWCANVDYLTLFSESAEVTIEGPPTSLFNLADDFSFEKTSDRVSCLPYPWVGRCVEICDAKTLSRVLHSTKGRFNEWRQCMLYEACKQNNRDLVNALLGHGVWKDRYRPTGNAVQLRQTTPMHVAAYSAGVETVKLLIENAAIMDPLNWEDNNGDQPLHIACRMGSLVMVALMIEAGANVNFSSPHTRDQPLHLAAGYAVTNSVILSSLLKHGADPEAQTAQGDTPLHLACMSNNIDKVKLLLAPDQLLTTKNHKGWTPLHVACRYGSLGLIRQVLLAGSPASSKGDQGQTPLHVACTRGELSVVNELLSWHDFPGEEDDWSQSPLVVAVSGFNFPIVTRLLDASYSPNFSCTITGKTILQQALSQLCFDAISVENRRNTIKTLMASGADPGMSDISGNTALYHWALDNSFSIDHNPREYAVYLEESWYSSLLHLLMDYGAYIGVRNYDGETPIDLAFRGGDMRKVEALQLVGGEITTLESEHSLARMDSITKSTYPMQYPDPEFESFVREVERRINPQT